MIIFIFLILFSILIQSLIYEHKLLLSHSLSINLPFSNDNFICFGNFSPFLIIPSLKYLVLYKLSTSDNNCSSLSLSVFLILVNIFCISNFKFSLSFSISSNIFFNDSIDSLNLFCKSSKDFIFSFNLFFFSSLIFSIIQTSHSLCWPCPFSFNFAIHNPQHNWLCSLQ